MPQQRAIGAILLVFLAWSAFPAGTAAADPAEPAQAPPAPLPAVGMTAPTFTVPDLNGNPVDVAGLIRGKPALVSFWASWCQGCIAEIPTLRALSREYRGLGLVIVGVGLRQGGETPEKQRLEAARELVNYQLVFDADKKYETTYGLHAIPFNVLLGPDGKISWIGRLLPANLEDRIKAHIIEARRMEGSPRE